MTAARLVLAIAGASLLVLAGCGGWRDKPPHLMNLRSSTNGPDEFSIVPPKPLEMPEDLAALPEPTPGGENLTDPRPKDDAVLALGGTPRTASESVPAADGALLSHAARNGIAADIRPTLAAEDVDHRRKNNGRLLERLFGTNVYFRAYRKQALDQQLELERWRAAGAGTPSAPPRQLGER
ncbi:DUF3035 domain-containing protein [Tabrizicola oligotrophica]|uniref:DUF3035 domain-containing protein n=1 Tax=Tabrizicola oligotrophica TaxID=2710650 RepID=A0A6M0QRX6_9RHOB|nr:DUF3035 domain-containing protein [Tabrizicola oligotrophica]NEY90178.1 DUF3035 domain-containing protein [Tabrizicola oligotrophica]